MPKREVTSSGQVNIETVDDSAGRTLDGLLEPVEFRDLSNELLNLDGYEPEFPRQLLIDSLCHEHSLIRLRAINALRRFGKRANSVVSALANPLTEDDPFVVAAAANAYWEITGEVKEAAVASARTLRLIYDLKREGIATKELGWAEMRASVLLEDFESLFYRETSGTLPSVETPLSEVTGLEAVEYKLVAAIEPVRDEFQRVLDTLEGKAFGSVEANREAAKRIQLLCKQMRLKIQCPKTGLAGDLRFRDSVRTKHGTFCIDVTIDGKRTSKTNSTQLPALKLVRADS